MPITQSITVLPTPPSRADPENFDTRADAFLGALPTMQTQMNTWAGQANQTALDIGIVSEGLTSTTAGANKVPLADANGKIDTAWLKVGTGTGQVAAGDHAHTSTYQPLDSDLTALAGLSTTGLIERTGAGTAGIVTVTAAGKALLDDADAAAQAMTLGLRKQLSANRTYYVRTDGSDSNSGLVNNAGGAFLTIGKAVAVVTDTLDLRGYTVTIQLGDGTYTVSSAIYLNPCVGNARNNAIIQGNTGDRTAVVIKNVSNDLFYVNGDGWKIQYVTFDMESGKNAVQPNKGNFDISNFNFIGYTGAKCFYLYGSTITAYITGSITISGNFAKFIEAAHGATCYIDAAMTVSGPCTFTTFIESRNCAVIIAAFSSLSTSDTMTGTRYSVANNGVLTAPSASTTYFPGSSAGTAATGGQYGGGY